MDFFFGGRAMLHAMGNDDELAFANYGFMIAKLHAQHAFDHEEQFVFNIMMVPDELAFDFDDLHHAVVDDAYLALIPEIGESAEFFLKIYGLHGILLGLQSLHNAADSGQNTLGGVGSRSLRVQTQKILCSRRAHHDPADFTEINFDAIHIFPVSHWPVEQAFELAVGKMSDGFFFLARLHVQIDAAIMVFAKLSVQRAQ